MLMIVLLALALLIASALSLLWIGDGSFRRGKLRALRRIRTVRRRWLGPVRARLKRTARRAWSQPVRSAVDLQVRRVADRVERASAAAERFIAAEQDLGSSLAQLEKLQPPEWAEGWHSRSAQPQAPASRPARGAGWASGLLLGLAAAALAVGNGWLMYRYVAPTLPDLYLVAGTVDVLTIGLAFAALPFLLGLVYYAMRSAGSALGLRVLSAVVVLVVLAIGAAEGAAVVLALEAIGFVELSWWGGIGVAAVLGATGALIPPTVAALASSAIGRVDDWMTVRERQRAGAATRQEPTVGRLRTTLESMTSGVQMLAAELRALRADPAGQLILDPGAAPTVERTGAVLRRLALAVERDDSGVLTGGASRGDVAGRVVGHLFILTVWTLAVGGALTIVAPALRYDADAGVTALIAGSALAALAALVVGGLLLRVLFASPELKLGRAGRGAWSVLVGLAVLSLSAVLAPLTAAVEGGMFEGQPLAAGAWLNLMVLTAAVASTRLREGVAAAAGVVTWVATGVARLALTLLDAVLALLDRLLGGRKPSNRHRPAPRGERRPTPTTGAAAGRG